MTHIKAKISEADKYVSLNPLFSQAFAFLKRRDLAKLPVGRYEIVDGKCWAMIQEPMLKTFEAGKLEAHRKFIDIQAPISDDEIMGFAETPDEMLVDGVFDVEKDRVLYQGESKKVLFHPGEFAIFFPGKDAHAPCLTDGEPRQIKKLVIKVLA